MGLVISIDGVDAAGKTTFLNALEKVVGSKNLVNIDNIARPIWQKLYKDEMSPNVMALFYYALAGYKQTFFDNPTFKDKTLIVERFGYTSVAFNRAAYDRLGHCTSSCEKVPLSQKELDDFISIASNDLEHLSKNKISFSTYLEKKWPHLLEKDVLTKDYVTNSTVLKKPLIIFYMTAHLNTVFRRINERTIKDPHETMPFLKHYKSELDRLYDENDEHVVIINTDKIPKKDYIKICKRHLNKLRK